MSLIYQLKQCANHTIYSIYLSSLQVDQVSAEPLVFKVDSDGFYLYAYCNDTKVTIRY